MIVPRKWLPAIAVALLAGCVSTPGQSPHEQPVAAAGLGLQGPAYAAPADGWWTALGDPQLDRLVQEALARNPTLAGSIARVRSAQEQAAIAGSANKPQLSATASATRERVSENYLFPPPYAGGTYWEARLGVDLAWNLDFWGRQASLIEQSSKVATGAALDAQASALLVSSSLAQAYLEYARARQYQALADRTGQQRQRLLALAQQRVQAGLDSEVELRGAEANLAQVDVEREQSRLAQQAAIHAIAALTGRGADAYASIEPPALDFGRALDLPRALPADLLAHRPDIAAAQARILAAKAGRSAAKASFYPNVDLNGFAGYVAFGLDNLLEPGSHQWQVGPALHLPIFDAGRLQAQYRKAGAELDVATASYNETVLRAIREAADQVSRLDSLDRQLADQQRSLEAAERAYSLAEQRYGAGLASQLTVLNAETQVLGARRQRVGLLADRTLARVALLVALGGCFQETTR